MFKDRQEIGINSEDNTYKQVSLGFNVQKGTKQQRGILEFVNSRIMITNS
jgi:hypothetical protein